MVKNCFEWRKMKNREFLKKGDILKINDDEIFIVNVERKTDFSVIYLGIDKNQKKVFVREFYPKEPENIKGKKICEFLIDRKRDNILHVGESTKRIKYYKEMVEKFNESVHMQEDLRKEKFTALIKESDSNNLYNIILIKNGERLSDYKFKSNEEIILFDEKLREIVDKFHEKGYSIYNITEDDIYWDKDSLQIWFSNFEGCIDMNKIDNDSKFHMMNSDISKISRFVSKINHS